MRKFEVLRNRRLSLDLSQEYVGSLIEVSGATISVLEMGGNVSYPVMAAYEQALQKEAQKLSEREQRERKILELAFSILDTPLDEDESDTLDYILIEIGRLSVLLDKKRKQEKKERNGEF